jgi:hypothetical protein
VAGNTMLNLTPGDYKLCKVTLGTGATVNASGGRVRILVDSPARSGSGCSGAGAGTFTAGTADGSSNSNTAKLNPNGSTNLEIYLYGTSAPPVNSPPPPLSCGDDMAWHNGASSATTSGDVYIYAPNSNVVVQSNARINGALAGCTAMLWSESASASFQESASPSPPQAQGTQTNPSTWRECAPAYTGDVEAGCNG